MRGTLWPPHRDPLDCDDRAHNGLVFHLFDLSLPSPWGPLARMGRLLSPCLVQGAFDNVGALHEALFFDLSLLECGDRP